MAIAPRPQTRTSSPLLQRLTVADGLLIVILGLAAVLRWGWLGMLPLSAEEAAEAVAIYQFGQGSAEFIVGSPTYFNLNVLLQFFLTATDASVRFIPTVFGLAIIALPWLLRDKLGTIGALITSLLLTISPIQQAISRSAGGDAIAVFAGILLFIGWLRWVEQPKTEHLFTIALAAALGLNSSPLFYSFLDNFIVVWFLNRLFSSRWHTTQPERTQWQPALVLGGTAFLGLSTLFFWNPAGLGASANLFSVWLQQFGLGDGFQTPWLAIVRYEPVPILLSLPLTAWLLRSDKPLVRWLVYWLFGSILLILVQAGNVTNLAVLTIPLFMLIGVGFDNVLAGWLDAKVGLLTLITTTWGFVLLVSVGRYLKLTPDNIAPLLIAFILLMAVGLAMLVLAPNGRQIVQSVMLGILVVGVYLGWGTGWSLTHHTGNDPRELWVTGGTDADMRLLRSTLQEGSYQLSRAQKSISLVSTIDSPAMHWYLRDFDDVTFAETVERDTTSDAIISSTIDPPTLNGTYARTDFDAEVMGASETPFSVTETLRWWFFRQSSAELNIDRVALWLRLVEE